VVNERSLGQRISRRRVLQVVAIALVIGASLALAGCGDAEETSPAAVTPTTTVLQAEATQQPTSAPEEERPWAFRGQRGITAAFPPADVGLYRSLLPESFDMPDQPLVVMTVVNYYNVSLPLVPYHEGYVLLQCAYQGSIGWYVLTLPVDNETADAGGRAIGFPKYVADEITLEEQEGGWTGRVVHGGRAVIEIVFTPEAGAQPVTGTTSGGGDVVFNLVPPNEGHTVFEVKSDISGQRKTTTTAGSATVKADAGEPWAGLLGPGGTAVWAVLEEMTGEWTLEATEQE
jgi:hypothetical protein